MKVELLFDKRVEEDVLNYYFHPTQKIKQNDDGTITVNSMLQDLTKSSGICSNGVIILN